MAVGIPKKIGKFDVLGIIGSGGMGIVYRGIDPSIGRPVAIKMALAFAHEPELLKRFYREAQSAGNLQHPNIVTIHELGEHEGNPYMVMEYIEGESLESIISHRKAIPLEQKLNIAIQLCDALSYAHQQNVIHRDIKPANVMVLKDFAIKIVDFGIARIGNENVTRPGQLMGSVPYMSPEQIKNKAYVDSRTDIFSAGVVLYQLLTYALPFEGKDVGAILLKIIHEAPPHLSTYLSSYPSGLDRILETALAKNVEQRYPSAERFAFDLVRVQDELKRAKISGCLEEIERLYASSQWAAAREQILQLLRMDRQNPRGNELLFLVEKQLVLQKRSEQTQQLRAEATQALSRNELGEALNYLDRAVELDPSNEELVAFRSSVAEQKARAEQVSTLLHHAESARETSDLEVAKKAVDDALRLDTDNREALALQALLVRDLEEQNKQRKVQGCVEEARKRISSRSFTGAIELLRQAEELSPHAPGVKELLKLAVSGQEQEIRRKQLEGFTAKIQDALNRDDFITACATADEGLVAFPEDRSLPKLKKLADKQRQASEKRAYIEGRIASARQALDSPEPQNALTLLHEALQRYPQEPALLSMLSVVNESLVRRAEEQRKADSVQQAKEAIRNRRYQQAIEILQAARGQITLIDADELDELVQFTQEEAANYAIRQEITAILDQTGQLISAGEYQKAIDLLESAVSQHADDELHIMLEDAHRRLREFNELLRDTISTAQRLLRQDRYADVVKFLQGQSEQFGTSPEFAALLDQARKDSARVHSFSIAKEAVREALSNENFAAASGALEDFQQQFGDIEEAGLLRAEIENARSRTAAAAMEKALSDVLMLLMVSSFDSAESIMTNVSQWRPYAPPELRQQYDSLQTLIHRGKEQRRAHELGEKMKQAQISKDVTVPHVESVDEEPIDATEGMSLSKLQTILGKITQVEQQLDNNKIQSTVGEFKKRLTLRIDALKKSATSSYESSTNELPVSSDARLDSSAPSSEMPVAEHLPPDSHTTSEPAEPRGTSAADAEISGGQRDHGNDGSMLTGASDLSPATFVEHDPEAEASASKIEAEQHKLLQQEDVRKTVEEARQLIAAGDLVRATDILRSCLAQNPDEVELSGLLSSAEEQLQAERQFAAIQEKVQSLIHDDKGEDAISLIKEHLNNGPAYKELLASTREAVAEQRRNELLLEARTLQSHARHKEALELVKRAAWIFGPTDATTDLEASLEAQIREQDAINAREADLNSSAQIEQPVQHSKDPELKQFLSTTGEISAAYPQDDEVTSVAGRIGTETESVSSTGGSLSAPSGISQSRSTVPSGISREQNLPDSFAISHAEPRTTIPLGYIAAGALCLILLVVGITVYRSRSSPHPESPPSVQNPAQQPIDSVVVKQREAIDAADKLFTAGDLAGARQKLQDVQALQGDLSVTVQQKLNTIETAMKIELGKRPETFAEALKLSQASDMESLKHANDLLSAVVAAGGPHKYEAEKLRAANFAKLQRLGDTYRQEQIADLSSQIDYYLRSGDLASARKRVDRLRQLGVDTTSWSEKIDQSEEDGSSSADEAIPSDQGPSGSADANQPPTASARPQKKNDAQPAVPKPPVADQKK